MFDYAGSIHFHSAYSFDAREPISEIVQAALRARLDFAIVTDHFRMDALEEGWERYHGNLLFLVGEEISPRYDRYLAFNLNKPVLLEKTHPTPQAMINEVNARGGFGFIAHPDHEGAPLVRLRAHPWTDWDVKGYAGIGIWCFMDDWSSSIKSYVSLLKAWLFPSLVLSGPRQKTLSRWDALCRQDRCAAIGETDNHSGRRSVLWFIQKFFPFEFAFRTVRTHVVLRQPLTGALAEDRAAIYDAIREGRSYVSLDLWNDPKGFVFEIFDGEQRATMGETFKLKGKALIEVKAPAKCRIRLIRNGEIIYGNRFSPYFERDVDLPGVYRVEVQQRVMGAWRPWIYSNPIWVNSSSS
jgi:hypothetical protein